VSVTNFSAAGAAQAWQLTSANTLSRLADLNYSGGTLSNTVPAQASPCSCSLPLRSRRGCELEPTRRPTSWNSGWMGRRAQLHDAVVVRPVRLASHQHQSPDEQFVSVSCFNHEFRAEVLSVPADSAVTSALPSVPTRHSFLTLVGGSFTVSPHGTACFISGR